ncbi:DUF885 domain-containing protein [Stackebrandtia nassauensis]|uniref:DUF885 domain-containing protein n=1 Tax=Stackebrandtia nassauensis (strain DSM 44728 / CIP 108903 / NRRL B-16338 / NBRC 102104 / LLR-40K-21) TaxID=446470 RepID=D3PZ18_STANL|nr:DUF885 domain-containing protein [Stackebrandtia nassauensis]ADD45447.1 protein of unknown function DUF885 [Stackebrandtia nassauensis DSM 44728]
MHEEYVSRAERVVDALLESDPEAAMWAGDHRFDDRLPDYSSEGLAAKRSMLTEASHALVEIDAEDLGTPDAVDLEILTNQVAARLFELTETRDHEWNPLVYNPGMLLNTLLLRPSAPAAERLTALQARLAAIPDHLATARANLTDVPAVYAETGAEQFRGTAALVRDEVPRLAEEAGATVDVETVAGELEAFADWLSRLPDGRSPRLGRRLWDAKLWHTLETPMAGASILDRAWTRLDEVTAELDELAARLDRDGGTADGASGAEVTARVLARLGADRPDNATVLDAARRAVAETTDFVREHDLITIPADRLEVVEMPEHDRGVSAAYLDPPGTLDDPSMPTFYAICPAPADWSTEQVASFYSEYNHHMIRNLTVHEAIPGHHVQLAHARTYRGNTRVRDMMMSGTFVEGWAVYTEELMVEHGYGGPEVLAQQLKMQLRMIINAIIDQSIHCDDMSEAEAMDLMTRRGHQAHAEAASKWRRALLSSTQLSTYFVGYTEMRAIADSCPTGRPGRDWHDRMLSFGSPAPQHVVRLLAG